MTLERSHHSSKGKRSLLPVHHARTTSAAVSRNQHLKQRRNSCYRYCCGFFFFSFFCLYLLYAWHPAVHRSTLIAYECLSPVYNYENCGCGPNPLPCPCWESLGWDTPPCIKERLVKIAVVVSQVLEEVGVQHYVVEGTLLGALRHGDMLPWENDVDFNLRLPKEGWLEKADQICKGVEKEGLACFVHPRDDTSGAKEWMYTKVTGRRAIVVYDKEYLFGLRQGVKADLTIRDELENSAMETVPCLLGETIMRCPKNFTEHVGGLDKGCILRPINFDCRKLFGEGSCEKPGLLQEVEEAILALDRAGYPSLINHLQQAIETNFQSC
ncbi:hypothetical protein QOT17_017469 [Balamuthia mandrillaris]